MAKNFIQLSYKNIETVEDFAEAICPRKNRYEMQQVLEAIKQDKLHYGDLQRVAEELGIPMATFNFLLRKLKQLGIITKDWKFSMVFQNKITSLSMFYGDFTGKRNKTMQCLNDANDFLRSKGHGVQFNPVRKEAEAEETRKQEELGEA